MNLLSAPSRSVCSSTASLGPLDGDTAVEKPEHGPHHGWLLAARSAGVKRCWSPAVPACPALAGTQGRVLDRTAPAGLFSCLPSLQMGILLPSPSLGVTSDLRRWPRLCVLPGMEVLRLKHRCITPEAHAVGRGRGTSMRCTAPCSKALHAEAQRGPYDPQLPGWEILCLASPLSLDWDHPLAP